SVALVLSASTFFGYRKWSVRSGTARDEALALMPSDASAILFVNFSELRRAPFIAQLYAWAPKPQADADYAQFVKDSGFDYERDLDRMAIEVTLIVEPAIFDKLSVIRVCLWFGRPRVELCYERSSAEFGEIHEEDCARVRGHQRKSFVARGAAPHAPFPVSEECRRTQNEGDRDECDYPFLHGMAAN